MSYEKHSTTTDALDTLGSIIGPGEKRDAIHLAVEPVVAAERLLPGEHVSLDVSTNTATRVRVGQGVGIVDPFIEGAVREGERFWLVVYPRQINSLRHVWEHADFAPSADLTPAPPAPLPLVENPALKAEAWLRKYAADTFGIGAGDDDVDDDYYLTFDQFIERAVESEGEYTFHISGADAHGEVPQEFWSNLSIYVGRPLTGKPDYFSCSC